MNAARPMGNLPMRRRSLRPKRIASGEPRKPKRRIANARRRKHRPKRIASGEPRKLKRRIANERQRKLKPKRITPDGRTADLRLRHEVHRAPRTKRPRLLELKPRPHNSRHRPTIHATKVNRATNGKRKTNGTDLAQGCRLLCERARRLRRALLLVGGPTTTGNHIRKSTFE